MLDWFSGLGAFPKFYWIIALLGSLIFVFIIITTFLGIDGSDDLDVDSDADFGMDFQFITFKNLIGFFTIFGWSGIACMDAGLSKPITVIVSIVCGLVMMTIMAAMFFYMRKLNHSGTLDYKNAIDAIGEVYLTIGSNRSSLGKVHIRVQGALRELEALSDSLQDLKPGTIVRVESVTSNGILIVNQTKKPIEPIKTENYELPDNTR